MAPQDPNAMKYKPVGVMRSITYRGIGIKNVSPTDTIGLTSNGFKDHFSRPEISRSRTFACSSKVGIHREANPHELLEGAPRSSRHSSAVGALVHRPGCPSNIATVRPTFSISEY
jgi:hypothetical protein